MSYAVTSKRNASVDQGSRRRGATGRRGFTLVELLIVVAILGIMAAIVIPHFTNASDTARDSALKEDLRQLRTLIETYTTQHQVAPGYPGGDVTAAPTQADFIAQLTQYTDVKGNVSATKTAVFKFGPYMPSVPVNPFNKSSDIQIVAGASFPGAPSGSEGWIYQPSTRRVAANTSGSDGQGQSYFGY